MNILDSGDSENIEFVRNLINLEIEGTNIKTINGDMIPSTEVNMGFKYFHYYSPIHKGKLRALK